MNNKELENMPEKRLVTRTMVSLIYKHNLRLLFKSSVFFEYDNVNM